MNRILRGIVGLGLIGYGAYSGIYWFYLGVVPLFTAIINWCPLESKIGGCDPESGCCATTTDATQTTCCSSDTPTWSAKKEDVQACCSTPIATHSDTMLVKVLGTGCPKCIELMNVVETAVDKIDKEVKVIKVEDIEEIMSYNVVSTPSLVINGKVVSSGKVLTLQEVIDYIG
jgi:thiol-disulfide isomerase/thioredoxin